MGVEQNRPIFTPGVAKRAVVEATARSQVATSWHPAAVAVACTLAITGCGRRTIASIMREQAAKVGVGSRLHAASAVPASRQNRRCRVCIRAALCGGNPRILALEAQAA